MEQLRLARWKGILASALFLLIAGGSAWWFVAGATDLHAALTSLPPTIVYSNGFGYTAGAFVAFTPLLLSAVYTTVTTRITPARYQKRGFLCVVVGLVIMLVATPLSSLWVHGRLQEAGYKICAPASSRWLNYRQAVYVRGSSDECEGSADENRARR
ncbi:hypothetical protein M8A51_13505 [Schlegelella sp. S2-27]|uniref:DUF1240 domain-containing protein n=1 Tax=Caldimonas mangrovi TaxID=2944811 RepID=A0ABT0YP69_9BURK|nr:hypothetical protein [Caldimonas mangrovi]MCM5680543.1 hypothetical protein [Caldimonas mangrovi]